MSEDDEALFLRAMKSLDLRRLEDLGGATGELPGAPGASVATSDDVADDTETGRAATRRPAPIDDADRALFLDAIAALTDPPVAAEQEAGEGGRGAPTSSHRRVGKRLERGEIVPERELDLHGLSRRDALLRVRVFLGAARADGVGVVRVITGRGLHSRGGATVRAAVLEALRGELREHVADVVRSPRSLGGEGAVVVFLRRPPNAREPG